MQTIHQLTLADAITQTESHHSPFEQERRKTPLKKTSIFQSQSVQFVDQKTEIGTILKAVPSTEKNTTPAKRIAVLFSGGPAAGGHNVVLGLKHSLRPEDTLFGVKAGPKGLLNGDLFELNLDAIEAVQNLGGFDLLGSDRTKIKTDEQFQAVLNTVRKFKLNGIIVIGGDDSNTNASQLADFLKNENCHVIGVPKTIDGDLQWGKFLPISFGFDTATKVYAELVGNILQDTPSSRKYWHFIKLMGRSASHVALEVALQTKPPVALISEEVKDRNISLDTIVTHIATVIAYRQGKGLNYGVVLIPEGLIEFIPDLVNSLPAELLQDRDSHGNLKVSQIETETVLLNLTQKKLTEIQKNPEAYLTQEPYKLTQNEIQKFQASEFSSNTHFFGYEGRCGAPSAFDTTYTYHLGLGAGALILNNKTGYIISMTTSNEILALPLSGMITEEIRDGKATPVIEKALVKLDSPAFKYFESRRTEWAKSDVFSSPGPRQYYGQTANQLPITVALNQELESIFFTQADQPA